MPLPAATLFRQARSILGIEFAPASHKEKLISAVGGFIAIAAIMFISHWFVGLQGAAVLVASMGASAVLLFAVPHGPLSQPWAVLGGHILSAIVGVSCTLLIPNPLLAGAVAVGAAIGVMYHLRCIHPPGGATALSAVVGGAPVHALGYQYVFTPVLLNVLVILLVAVVFNYLFVWRRYPAGLHVPKSTPEVFQESSLEDAISHEDFVYAFRHLDTFIDVSERDLLRIYELAVSQGQKRHLPALGIKLGSYYSNGEYGDNWAVRRVIDEAERKGGDDILIYRGIAGKGRRKNGVMSREEFARWAKYEVFRDEENWRRVHDAK